MTIQDLGSIGELAAAVATIATLLYLSRQIRQNTRISRSAVVSELQQKYIDFYNVVLANDELTLLLAKLKDPQYQPESDAENEKVETFSILLYSIWLSVQTSFDQGLLDQQTYDIYCEDVANRLKKWPALRSYFVDLSDQYPTVAKLPIYQTVYEREIEQ